MLECVRRPRIARVQRGGLQLAQGASRFVGPAGKFIRLMMPRAAVRARDGGFANLHLLFAARAAGRLSQPGERCYKREFLRGKEISLTSKGNLIAVAQGVYAEHQGQPIDAHGYL